MIKIEKTFENLQNYIDAFIENRVKINLLYKLYMLGFPGPPRESTS